jgi:Yip1-like protein
MTTPPSAAGSAPAPKNLLARFIGVLTSPRDTFFSVAASPKWLGMLALTAVIVGIFTALPMTTEAGRQAAIDQQVTQMQSFGMTVSDQMYEQMEKRSGTMPYTTAVGAIVVTPIFALIIAGILFAIFNAALGGEATFKQVYAVYVHAGVISATSAVFSGIVNYFRGSMGSVANVGALLPMLSEKSFAGRLLGMVDVFLIWYIVVLAIGLAVLYRRRTQPIAISLLSIYAVIAIVIALIKSRVGGA